ncbi:MAG: hypothetical protein SGARI_001508 [Bacillariaceae sp.]
MTRENMVKYKIVHYGRDFPYIRGTYSSSCPKLAEDGPPDVYGGKHLLIAGEAFPIPKCQIGFVDGAALSGLHAAELILSEIDSTTEWKTIPESLKNKWQRH